MAEVEESPESTGSDRGKRILIYAAVLVLVFLLGLVPMGYRAYSCSVERDQARRELRACQIEKELASAAVDARLGNYEPARVAASNFFTQLGSELETQNESAFAAAQRDNLKALLSSRDEIITLLARSDPAGADRLSNLFVSFRRATGRE